MMRTRLAFKPYALAACATAILAGVFFAEPSSLPAVHPPHLEVVYVNWKDTGQTVALGMGQELFVKLPIRGYHDDTWHVREISPSLKLVKGPDELRPVHWSPWKFAFQVFYFQRTAPGAAQLVMEPNYFLKPMVLKVVDR
jgi:hypothetical protein